VSRACIVALLTVLGLTIGGQCVIRALSSQLGSDAHLGRLASLYRITGTKLLKDFHALDDPAEKTRSFYANRMHLNLLGWKKVHDDLMALPEGKAAIQDTADLERSYQLISSAIESANVKDISSLTATHNRIALAERDCESSMDFLVGKLSSGNEAREAYTEQLQLAMVLITLCVLFVEFRYMFAPALRKLRANVLELESARSDFKHERELVQNENEKLLADQEMLQEIADNLESANQRFEVAAKRFEELFQGMPIACFGYDGLGTIFEWNRACEELFGIHAAQLFGTTIYQVLAPDGNGVALETAVTRAFNGESVQNLELQWSDGKGTRHLLCGTFPIHGPEHRVSGAIFSCVDITAQKEYEQRIEEQLTRINEYSSEIEQRKWELEEANARLQSLASTDGLTGLQNHRSFQEVLARDLKRSARDDSFLSVVLLDVDEFKKYNDSFGHPAGDAILKQLADILLECSRESDLVARYGGEEFIAILPNTSAEGAIQMAERMRTSIDTAVWKNRKVTASFGVATTSGGSGTTQDLIQAADKALYASKAAGRNKVLHSQDIGESSVAA
jgi:diguanylate cyclase (GGDEF)-like protein/PAS domain S-box-containing protein